MVHGELNPGQPVYNEVEAVRFRGELNVEALERALNAVIARHEILTDDDRSRRWGGDGESVRVTCSALEDDRSCRTDAAEREAELERLLISEPRIPYHLEEEPAIRATLIRLARTRACLHADDAPSDLRLVIGGRVVAGIVRVLPRILP